ncbi:hypothetical protein C7N43_21410 [Sphingobacteriales bacterium UPWRP_1]|nr:hypothetical protein B6N25_01505 [Sphingobacteriales bacterium TSM_CSS]PSJ74971.1 hypothetical protein C7N43_21410 [Sphingobacteriales bacterium UPWRP_1]
MQPIRYLGHHQIDRKKWDNCILQAANSLPYAFSWYLDIVSPEWEALVAGNYEAVMPLTRKTKYTIAYLYKPLWAQQLGVFSGQMPNAETVNHFLQAIPSRFRLVQYTLNEANGTQITVLPHTERVNHLLPLNQPYRQLYSAFNQNTRRNLKKALQQPYTLHNNIAPPEIIDLYRNTAGKKLPQIQPQHYLQMERIIYQSLHRHAGLLYGVYNQANQLHAAAFFLHTGGRIINLFPATSDEGRTGGAMFLLLNHVIQQFAGTSALLDFEGSVSPSVSQFYRGFGAVPVTYCQVQRNTLPLPFKWLKK